MTDEKKPPDQVVGSGAWALDRAATHCQAPSPNQPHQPVDQFIIARLTALLKRWHDDKSSRFKVAKEQPDPMLRRTAEHGGVVLFNACRAVEAVLLDTDAKCICGSLHALITEWSISAVKYITEARVEPYLPGAKLMEHGARVTLNCAIALRLVLLAQNPGDQRACDLALEVFEQDAKSP